MFHELWRQLENDNHLESEHRWNTKMFANYYNVKDLIHFPFHHCRTKTHVHTHYSPCHKVRSKSTLLTTLFAVHNWSLTLVMHIINLTTYFKKPAKPISTWCFLVETNGSCIKQSLYSYYSKTKKQKQPFHPQNDDHQQSNEFQ
jgi:hypothetical protein